MVTLAVWPTFASASAASNDTVTGYSTTLFTVVDTGETLTTWAATVVDVAGNVTDAVWPAFTLAASASAMFDVTTS